MQKEEVQLRCQLPLFFTWRPQGYYPFTPVFICASGSIRMLSGFIYLEDIEVDGCIGEREFIIRWLSCRTEATAILKLRLDSFGTLF